MEIVIQVNSNGFTSHFPSMDPEFDEERTLVIQGALDRWEKGGKSNAEGDIADIIRRALKSIFKEEWSILVCQDGACEDQAGTYCDWHWENGWTVYGVCASKGPCKWRSIFSFMEDEWGGWRIADLTKAQKGVENRVNKEKGGRWKVQIVKFRPDAEEGVSWFSSTIGTRWDHDGHFFFVRNQSE
jgi:hypothetical protein